jgi:GNAT superfamily N-acetyltransferase
MILRKAEIKDITAMTSVFVSAVESSTAEYSAIQRAALVSGTMRQSFWNDLLQRNYVIAAFEMVELIGFCSFSTRGEIEMLYVHPNMQRKGIATRIIAHLREYASHEGYAHLKINALAIFEPWLERMKFEKIESAAREDRGVLFDLDLFVLDLL